MSPLPVWRSSWRGPLSWTLAILGTLAVTVAIGVRIGVTARGGSVLQSTYEVRAVLGVAALVVAYVLRRAASRPERIGLVALAAALLLTMVIDLGFVRLCPVVVAHQVFLGMSIAGWTTSYHVVRAMGGLLLPAFVAGHALGIGEALYRAPRPLARPIVVAALSGLLLLPSLSAAKAYGEALQHALHRLIAPQTRVLLDWPTVQTAFRHVPFEVDPSRPLASTIVTLSFTLPAMEVLLHGVLRASFGRWGLLPFVAGTAFCAAILCMEINVNYGVLVGALATGLLAARSGSVIPGLVFWQAVYVGAILWGPWHQAG